MAKFAQSPLFLVLVCVAAIRGASALCSIAGVVSYSTSLSTADYSVSCTAAGNATVRFTIPATITDIGEFGINWATGCAKATVPASRIVILANIPCGVTVTAWGVAPGSVTSPFVLGSGSPACLNWGTGSPSAIQNNAAGCRVRRASSSLLISCATPSNAGQTCTLNGPSGGPCDAADSWAAACTCPDTLQASGTKCADKSAAPCDADDLCTGSSKTCPDLVEASSVKCSTAVLPCDADDYCPGPDSGAADLKACPDGVQASGFKCADAGPLPCDADDLCDGTLKTCPDLVQANGTACAPASAGACDLADTCLGPDAAEPKECPEKVKDAGTVCRESASPCDAAEECLGPVLDDSTFDVAASKACPADICQMGGAPSGNSCPARRRLF